MTAHIPIQINAAQNANRDYIVLRVGSVRDLSGSELMAPAQEVFCILDGLPFKFNNSLGFLAPLQTGDYLIISKQELIRTLGMIPNNIIYTRQVFLQERSQFYPHIQGDVYFMIYRRPNVRDIDDVVIQNNIKRDLELRISDDYQFASAQTIQDYYEQIMHNLPSYLKNQFDIQRFTIENGKIEVRKIDSSKKQEQKQLLNAYVKNPVGFCEALDGMLEDMDA